MRNLQLLCFALSLVFLSSFSAINSPQSHYIKGMEHLKSKDLIQAIGDFTTAISLNSEYGEAYYQRGVAKDLLAKKIGFKNTESCVDYLEALNRGVNEAIEPLRKSCMGECFGMSTVFLEPDVVFCADMSSKILATLPAHMDQLHNVLRLNLFNNKLVTVGDEIGQMPNLVELDMSSNKLVSLNANIGRLSQLRELNLNKNHITALPSELGKLKNLESLYMRQNELTDFNPACANLSNLKHLDLSFNKLTNLPLEIKKMVSLRELVLVGNSISKAEQQKITASLPTSCKVYFE